VRRRAKDREIQAIRIFRDAGVECAKKLAEFIPERIGAPNFIFVSAILRYSARPYETVRPLSKRIGIPIGPTIAANGYGVLAQELLTKARYQGALVFVFGIMVKFRGSSMPYLRLTVRIQTHGTQMSSTLSSN
jgi:hypothetical protein